MQSNQQSLINFFSGLFNAKDIRQSFFEDIIKNTEVFAQKEASLLAIKSIYEYSYFGEYIAEDLVEQDHYALWEHVEFDSKRTIFIQAKDLNAAHQLGFILCVCTKSTHMYGGFIHSKELYDSTYSSRPFYHMIEETKAQELGIKKSSDGYYYQPGCLLAFRLDRAE